MSTLDHHQMRVKKPKHFADASFNEGPRRQGKKGFLSPISCAFLRPSASARKVDSHADSFDADALRGVSGAPPDAAPRDYVDVSARPPRGILSGSE